MAGVKISVILCKFQKYRHVPWWQNAPKKVIRVKTGFICFQAKTSYSGITFLCAYCHYGMYIIFEIYTTPKGEFFKYLTRSIPKKVLPLKAVIN
jgi:hypothetical protein